MKNLQTVVYMVRHGDTDQPYSTDGAKDGQRQLSEHGRAQAKADGVYLNEFKPSALYSSPLDRCQDTAQVINQQLESKLDIQTDQRLLELYDDQPEEKAKEKSTSVLHEIVSKHRGSQVIVVTHQYIIGYYVAEFLGINYNQLPCGTADIYRLVFAGDELVEATRLQPAAQV